MKKLTLVLSIVLSVFIGKSAIAQEGVSKSELLNSLNKVDHLGLSKEKSSALKDYNRGFVDSVYDITESNKSDDDKIIELKKLRDKGDRDLKNILGEDHFKSVKKSMKKELRPLKRKVKLFKFIV